MHDGVSSGGPELYAALAAARRAAPAVAKNGFNRQGNYSYAPGDDVIEACRACLAAQGLSLIPVASRLIEAVGGLSQGIETRDGKAGYAAAQAVLATDYALVHADGAVLMLHEETPVCPGPGRPADKALFAAQTEQLAYLYRGILGAKRGDALDVAGRGEDEDGPRPTEHRAPLRVTPRLDGPGPIDAPSLPALTRRNWLAEIMAADAGALDAIAADLAKEPDEERAKYREAYAARRGALRSGS